MYLFHILAKTYTKPHKRTSEAPNLHHYSKTGMSAMGIAKTQTTQNYNGSIKRTPLSPICNIDVSKQLGGESNLQKPNNISAVRKSAKQPLTNSKPQDTSMTQQKSGPMPKQQPATTHRQPHNAKKLYEAKAQTDAPQQSEPRAKRKINFENVSASKRAVQKQTVAKATNVRDAQIQTGTAVNLPESAHHAQNSQVHEPVNTVGRNLVVTPSVTDYRICNTEIDSDLAYLGNLNHRMMRLLGHLSQLAQRIHRLQTASPDAAINAEIRIAANKYNRLLSIVQAAITAEIRIATNKYTRLVSVVQAVEEEMSEPS